MWLPPMDRPSPSPVITHTCRSGLATFTPGGDGVGPAVDAVEAVGVHVVREAAGAADARDHHHVLLGHADLRQHGLHAVDDRVVAAARAPADFLVGLEVLGFQLLDVTHAVSSRILLKWAFSSGAKKGLPLTLWYDLEPELRVLAGQQTRQLAHVKLGHDDALEPGEDLLQAVGQRTQVAQVQMRPTLRPSFCIVSTAAADRRRRSSPSPPPARPGSRARSTRGSGSSRATFITFSRRGVDHDLVVVRIVGDVAACARPSPGRRCGGPGRACRAWPSRGPAWRRACRE